MKEDELSSERHLKSMGRREMCIGFWKGNLKRLNSLTDLHVDGKMILQIILKEAVGRV